MKRNQFGKLIRSGLQRLSDGFVNGGHRWWLGLRFRFRFRFRLKLRLRLEICLTKVLQFVISFYLTYLPFLDNCVKSSQHCKI